MDYKIIFGIAALVSAASWALGDILWRKIGEELTPISMNLTKVIIGSACLLLVLLVIGIEPVNMRDFLFLGISGLIGIAVGDTFFFMSLMQLGPRLSALMGTLAPVFITLSAVIFLGERPSFLTGMGILLTVSGVAWVLWERLPQDKIIRNKSLGVKYSLLSTVCVTVSVLLAKIGVKSIPTIQATSIRLLWAAIGLILLGCLNRQLKTWLAPLKTPRLFKKISFVVLIVVFGGFWLSLLALKYIDASIASTLTSTTPLFILPMVIIMLKEKISIRAVFGAAIAVIGVAFIFMAK